MTTSPTELDGLGRKTVCDSILTRGEVPLKSAFTLLIVLFSPRQDLKERV